MRLPHLLDEQSTSQGEILSFTLVKSVEYDILRWKHK